MDNVLSSSEEAQYAEFKRRVSLEAARAQAAKLELDYLDCTADKNLLKRACQDANVLGIGAICVLPNYVKACVNYLGKDPKTSLIACISYPHGADTLDIKVAALKRAVKDGIDEAEVTAPLAYIKDGNWGFVKKEFKKLKKAAKDRGLRINLESPLLTPQEIAKTCRVAVECGITSLRCKSENFLCGFDSECVAEVKQAVKDKCTIKADGVTGLSEMNEAVNLGAGIIGSKSAFDLARLILRE